MYTLLVATISLNIGLTHNKGAILLPSNSIADTLPSLKIKTATAVICHASSMTLINTLVDVPWQLEFNGVDVKHFSSRL